MALFSYPVCTWLCQYVNMGVRKWLEKSAEKQKYKLRKTINPLSRKAFQAVSFSATKDTSEQALYRLLRLFYKSQSALTPLLLLSKSNPLRWASIWFWVQNWKCGVYSVAMLHVAAKSALRPRLFMPAAKKDVIRPLPCFFFPNRIRCAGPCRSPESEAI